MNLSLRRYGWTLGIVAALATAAWADDMPPPDEPADPAPVAPLLAPSQPPGPVSQVYLDDSPAAQDLLDQARQLRRQDRLPEAAGRYQQIIEQHGQRLMPIAPGRFTDARQLIEQTLIDDAALLAAYRRLYEPLAERLLERAIGNQDAWPDPVVLAEVVDHYLLCQAGLRAGLQLAGMHLLVGEPMRAGHVLDQLADHPDLDGHMARWRLLQALAGLYGDQTHRVQTHLASLHQLGDADALAQFQQHARQVRIPAVPTMPTPDLGGPVGGALLARSRPAQAAPVLGRPLWEVTVPAGQDGAAAQASLRSPRQPEAVEGFAMLPLARGERLFVNDGQAVIALDRFSGRRLWTYQLQDDDSLNLAANHFLRTAQVFDQRSVAVGRQTVAAVVGKATSMRMAGRRGRQHATRLVSLSSDTGQLRWTASPGELDESLSNAFFHGTPILDGDRVLVLARRSQVSGFHSAYVLAVSLADGKLLWRRHLSSAAMGNRHTVRHLAEMRLIDGRLYVADQLGAVVCLDSPTGSVRWLTVLPELAQHAQAGQVRRSAQVIVQTGGPLQVAAGLLVPTSMDQTLLIDPATGEILQQLDQQPWAQMDYLMPAGRDVICVGPSPVLIDGQSLEARWEMNLGALPQARPAGIGAITAEHVVLPTQRMLIVAELADGQVIAEHRLDQPGNVLVLQDQILLTGESTVRCYMAWDDAKTQLRHQIARDDQDPEPALALAHLALSTGHHGSMIDAVDAALLALTQRQTRRVMAGEHQTDDPVHRQVFQQLLTFVQPEVLPDAPLRRELFDRLARITQSPGDEVLYQLAFGRFLEQVDQVDLAVDHYQAVLRDPVLAQQLYQQDHSARQAGLEATARLSSLIERHGPAIYHRQQLAARQQLEHLLGQPTVTPEQLIELARQYPLTAVAADALLAGAQQLIQRDQMRMALPVLRRAYRMTADPAIAQQAAGLLTAAYESLQQRSDARRWLRRLARDYPDHAPIHDGQHVPVDLWLARLDAQMDDRGWLPILEGALGQPMALPGRLLPAAVAQEQDLPGDLILLELNGQVQLRQAPAFALRWEAPLPGPDTQLLTLGPDQALLFSRHTGKLTALDTRTGQPAWPGVDVAGLLEQLGGEAERRAAQPAQQRQFMDMLNPMGQVVHEGRIQPLHQPPPPGYHVAVSDMVICVSDMGGRTLGISRQTGQVLWRFIAPVDQVSHLVMHEDAVVMVGIVGLRTDVQGSNVMVLDPQTGRHRRGAIDERGQIRWISLSEDDLLIYATASQVVAHHLDGRVLAWRVTAAGDHPSLLAGYLAEDSLVVRDGHDSLMVIDPASGQLRERMQLPPVSTDIHRQRLAKLHLEPVEQQWHLLTERSAMALDSAGRLLWRDAMADVDQTLVAQLVGQQQVVLLGIDESSRRVQLDPMPGGMMGDDMQQPRHPGLDAQGDEAMAVERAIEPRLMMAQPPEDAHHRPGGWTYYIHLLDRQGGRLRRQHLLGPLPEPIVPGHATLLHGAVIVGTASTTIVLPHLPHSEQTHAQRASDDRQ